MGMDFVALLRYGGPGRLPPAALDRLEAGPPTEVEVLARLMRERGFWCGDREAVGWKYTSRPEVRDRTFVGRPALPRLDVAICLPQGFALAFGADAVEAYHLLRWSLFLTEPDLRQAMLAACVALGRMIGATDCVLTSDYSPVVQAFRRGEGFAASLAAAGPEDGERPKLSDLYQELADGTWDSHGYWRLALGPANPDLADRGVVAASRWPPRSAGVAMDPARWVACSDPAVMLDAILKRDGADWRKVRLWACACVRRLWLRLTTEPVRRAVEVAERFADGLAGEREVGAAASGAAKVRKGDRRANQVAWRLAQLCLPSGRFPPADVSEAAAEAGVGAGDPAARAAELAVQAGLLRDVVGSWPPRPHTIDPLRVTPTVTVLAQAAYDERSLPDGLLDPTRLGVLADAAEEAGCVGTEVLAHLRGPGPHVRGCFAVDALLGRA